MAQGERGEVDGCRSPACHAGGVAAARSIRAVIIPAYRAQGTLARTLASILEGNREFSDLIIVVCSPADEREQVDVARSYAGVVVVESAMRLSAGAARNLGRRYAPHADLLLFVDADCAPDPGTLSRLLGVMDATGAAAVGASVANASTTAVARVRHLLEFKDSEPGVRPNPDWMAASATLLCRADAFDSVGGFADMWPGEDLVFCWRLARRGLQVRRAQALTTRHLHPPGASALLRHQYRLGRTSARARLTTGMPGARWARTPILAPLLFAARLVRAAIWLLRYRPKAAVVSILLLPLYLAGLSAWTFGFVAESAAAGGGTA